MAAVVTTAASAFANSSDNIRVGRCAEQANAGGCDINWDFSSTPGQRKTVERWSPGQGDWEVVRSADTMRRRGSERVAGGYLYRIQRCNGRAPHHSEKCNFSSVVWVPVFLPEQEIPAEVINTNGDRMTVDKNGSLNEQLEQYNVYLLVRTLGAANIDLANLPSMTKVTGADIWANGSWSFEQEMQRSFFINYSGLQQLAKAKDK
jgi:hypothetical protein